jgi:hypothetical protein
MPPKNKNHKIEQSKKNLEEPLEEISDVSSDDDNTPPPASSLEKPKRPRTQAQIDSLKKAIEKKKQNFLTRKGLADKAEEEIAKIIQQKKDKKDQKKQKLVKLQELTEQVSSEDEEEPPVIIKKKVKKQTKQKVIYVDSDDEEVEKPIDKNIIIINKMHPTTSHNKPKTVQPEKPTFLFL